MFTSIYGLLPMSEITFYSVLWRWKKRERSVINHLDHDEMFINNTPKIPGKHRRNLLISPRSFLLEKNHTGKSKTKLNSDLGTNVRDFWTINMAENEANNYGDFCAQETWINAWGLV